MFRDGIGVFPALLLCFFSANGQYTLTGPSSAPEGSTVTFTCTTSPVQTSVVWRETSGSNTSSYIYFYNSGTGRCQRSSGSPPSDYTLDCNSTGVFSLSFPADYSRHRGSVFTCSSADGSNESNSITLSVSVPLTSVSLLNATSSPLTVEQDTDVTLVCETNPTDPESTISWRQDGQSVSQGVTSSTRQETGGVVTVSVWSQRAQWTDRSTYSCEALNSGVTRTSQNLTLNVQVPVSSVTLTNITNHNQQVPVNQDSSLVLTCQTRPAYPEPTVTWYINSIMTSSGVTSRTEIQTSGQIVTVSTMTRTMRKNNDQDTFYCRAENINGVAGTQSKTARANVYYGPDTNMVNLTKPVVIAERNDVTLTCSTLNSVNPEVDFTWWWGDNTAITAGLSNKQGAARGSWSQTLTVRAVRDSNRQEIRCDVINTQTGKRERVVVDLGVSYGPDSGGVQVSKSSTAVELEPLSLTCSSTNNINPGVTFTWTVDGSEVTSGTGDIQGSSGGKWSQTLTLTTTRGQSSVGCTVINTAIARQESSSVDLDVNYPPDISLSPVQGPQNTDLTLTCTATGNPSNYRFEDFRQYWGDQLIQRRGGTQTGDRYSLDLLQVSYQDSGVYVCTVGNNIKQPSHKNATVTVKASPVYTKDVDPTEPVGAEVGDSARLVQYVYCSPNITSVSWTFNTTTSRLSTDSSSVSSSPVHLDVYGTQVEVTGIKIVYTVTNFQQEHVGLYTVSVCNSVGCEESSIKLIGSGPPETPKNLAALNSTTDSVTLTWTPQYAGGDYTQEFHVEFRVQNTSGDWSSRVFPLSQDNSGAGVVNGLDSNTGYVFRIKSVTDRKTGINQSPVSEEIYLRTKETHVETTKRSSLGVGAGIGIGVGICLLIPLVGVGVVVLLRRQECVSILRTRRPQRSERTSESREDTAPASGPNQSVYAELDRTGDSNNYEKLGHVYQNSGLEMEHVGNSLHSSTQHYENVNDPTYVNGKREKDKTYENTQFIASGPSS